MGEIDVIGIVCVRMVLENVLDLPRNGAAIQRKTAEPREEAIYLNAEIMITWCD
jgi:hypothetical protein